MSDARAPGSRDGAANEAQPFVVDLTNCDREPIHIPGSVQPHGALLAVDPKTLRVRSGRRRYEPALGSGAF